MALDYKSISTAGWYTQTAAEETVRIATLGYLGTALPPTVVSGYRDGWLDPHAGLRVRGR